MFCLHTCLYTTCMLCLQRTGRVWGLSRGCWKTDSRLLEGHQVFLSAESSFHFQTSAPCFCSEYQGLNCQACTLLLSQIPAPCWILILLGYNTLLLHPHSFFLKIFILCYCILKVCEFIFIVDELTTNRLLWTFKQCWNC